MIVDDELGETQLKDMVDFIMSRREDEPEVASEIIRGGIIEALDMTFGAQVSNCNLFMSQMKEVRAQNVHFSFKNI